MESLKLWMSVLSGSEIIPPPQESRHRWWWWRLMIPPDGLQDLLELVFLTRLAEVEGVSVDINVTTGSSGVMGWTTGWM